MKPQAAFGETLRRLDFVLGKWYTENTSKPIITFNPIYSNRKKTGKQENTVISAGAQAIDNIKHALLTVNNKPDYSGFLDNIKADDVEKNIPIAESVIKKNIDSGKLRADAKERFPYLLDGLAVRFTGDGVFSKKEQRALNDVSYWEKETAYKPAEFSYTNNGLTNNISEDNLDKLAIKNKWDFKSQPQTTKASEHNSNESSKTNKYSFGDALADLSPLPSFDDYNDLFTDIKNKDFISALTDISRICFPFGLAKSTKSTSRYIWKLGADLYLRGVEGYTISADLLEHSLQEKPKDLVFYDNSEIADSVKKDADFLKKVDSVVEKIENNEIITSDDKSHSFNDGDLFFSIHGCNVEVKNIKYNEDGTKDVSIHISDTYDYTKIWTAMNSTTDKFDPTRISLGSLANDAGTITSWFDAINPYEVDIYLTVRR